MSKHTVRADEMEGDSFTGVVKKAYYEEGEDYQGNSAEFVILEVETDFMVEPFRIKMKYSKRKRSLFGKFIQSMEENAGVRIPAGKDIDVLKGQGFKFERTDIKFGEFTVEQFPLPVEALKGKGKKSNSDDEEEEDEKPKKKSLPRKPAKSKSKKDEDEDEDDDEDEEEDDDDDDDEEDDE